jgi:hypothetical protein
MLAEDRRESWFCVLERGFKVSRQHESDHELVAILFIIRSDGFILAGAFRNRGPWATALAP